MTLTPAVAALGALAAANLAMAVAPAWRKKHPNAERTIELISVAAMFAVIIRPELLGAPSSPQPLTSPGAP